MTDSVKYSAFSERILRAVLAIWSGVGLASAGLVIMDFQAREGLYGRTPDGKGDAGAVSAGSVPAGAAVHSLGREGGGGGGAVCVRAPGARAAPRRLPRARGAGLAV